MKTFGRILIILTAFTVLGGLMMWVGNANGVNSPTFARNSGEAEFRPPQGDEDGQEGSRPPREVGEDHEGREGRGGFGGRWVFSLIKNVGVISVLVVAIVLPKSIIKKKRKAPVSPA